MAQLTAATWISVGLATSSFALIFDQLILFIVPGVLFIIIGAAKLLRRPAAKSAPQHTYNTKPRQTTEQQTKRCYVCQAKNHPQANYCGHCGHKLT